MKSFLYGNENAPIVLVQPADGHDLAFIEDEVRMIRELTGADFCLAAVQAENWNRDLSPWEAPAVFGNGDFGGKAAETLDGILEMFRDDPRRLVLGGYSLAGLFALWAATRTDRFAGIAAASPSVWFPGFTDYLRENPVRSGAVYLSLGDREERTRNPVMAEVGNRIREAEEILKGQGVKTVLEWNPGNHFRDADGRTARAFAWALNETKGETK